MTIKLRTVIWTAVGIASLVGAYFAVSQSVADVDFESLSFDLPQLLAASLVFALSYLYTAFLWHTILRMADAQSTRANDAASWLVSQFGKYVPGNVTVIAIRIGRSTSRPAVVASAALQEAAFQLVVGGLIGLPALLGVLNLSDQAPWLLALAAVPFVVIVVVPGALHTILNRALTLLRREALDVRPPTFGETLRLLSAFVVFWLLAGTAFWLFVGALTSGISWTTATSAIAFAWIIGFLAIAVPGGIGVREAAIVLVLGPELGTGTVLILAAAQRAWMTVLEVMLSAGGFLILRFRGSQVRPEEVTP